MKFIVEVFVEVMPLLWLLFTIIHYIMGHDALPMLCFTIFQFLTVYVLLWSKDGK
jgi:hypothetical protein